MEILQLKKKQEQLKLKQEEEKLTQEEMKTELLRIQINQESGVPYAVGFKGLKTFQCNRIKKD